ncbi:hypothetical protein MATL_G00001010 [Megalops atlanticus]|uniref:CUB domain-containing protein n=1 Tax=Megalops atlanticus TaxID=7932 RepID=A0A9D3TGV4_MEGAT|nr:hypothetical protein MATL_G00001010 [Megalops atlanticus]
MNINLFSSLFWGALVLWKGAELTGEAAVYACGRSLTEPFGRFSSQDANGTSGRNMSCLWTIVVPADRVMILTFTSFQHEAFSDPWCRNRGVKVNVSPNIFNGDSDRSPLMGRQCGSIPPGPLVSATNALTVVSYWDNIAYRPRFIATYRTIDRPWIGCGGRLTKLTETIISPGTIQHGRYKPNMDCVWTIATPPDHVIIFTFLFFSLEGILGQKCRYDYVQLFNGSSTSSPAMGMFCGRAHPSPFVSTTNFLTVRFYSDSTVSRRGFGATYRAIGTRSATAGGPQ